ncbi:protein DDI1 homolog 2 isoform X2 [Xenopus tropicalis]|uniref:Protein DDI1 homolog 2 n=1 Tax=Xenopus tropicalis TaxID=8364 RepID=A0A8J1JSX0_XENTR|nr:protein DDI1 homolog 2 isoform X2 [Xenopus tropicalis]
MLITVYCVRRDLSEVTFSLEVDGDFELENFRALCELESGIPASETLIVYAERPLTNNQRSLASYGLKDGDVVILRQRETPEARPAAPFPGLDFSTIAVPGSSSQPAPSQPQAPPPPPPDTSSFPQGLDNPALLREMLLANPHELSLLKERNPPLAEALLSGDLEKFTKVLLEQQQERARREQERIRLYSADPFDLEAQAKIEEDIRQQNIEENMTIAMEEAPESFGQVVMLYINCKVNGYPVKAFVDSGAQMTIMSQACAERCHIMRLVDRRWAGIAKGVGTQKIIGRVHLAQVQIEGDFLPCSFSILEEQPMDMLLGLDMLKRHQCSIDLEKNVLVIGTTGTRTSFLPEGELPECARLAYGPGREEVRPEEIADRELAEVLQKSAEEADTETTSLVSPTDGLASPAHASGTAATPSAHSATSPTTDRSLLPTGTDCIEPSEGAAPGHRGHGCLTGLQTGQPPSVLPPSSAGHHLPLRSVNPRETSGDLESSEQPMELRDFHSLFPGLPVRKEMEHVGGTQSVPPPSQGDTKDIDGGADGSSPPSLGEGLSEGAPPAATESPMEVDYLPVCHDRSDEAACVHPLHGAQTRARGSANEQRGSMAPAVELQLSEMPDGTTEVVCPFPPSAGVSDGEDNSFSLATALKELHKLLVTSGQGLCRLSPDDKTSYPLDTYPNDTLLGGQSCQSSSNDPTSIHNSLSVTDNVVSDERLYEPEEGRDLKSPKQEASMEECTTTSDVELQSPRVEMDSKAGDTLETCPVSSAVNIPVEITDILPDKLMVKQEAGTGEETILEAGTGEETILEAGTGEETILEAGTGEETILEAGTGEETILDAGTGEETILEAGTGEETILEAGTGEETIMDAGTGQETIMDTGTREETTMEAGTGQETTMEAGTGQETTMEAGTGQETTMEAGTGQETTMEAGTGEETTMEAGTGEETILEAGTGEEPIIEAGTGEEPIIEVGTAEETVTQNQGSSDQALPVELGDVQSVPAAGASPLFAPSDIDRIVSAGFTLQDAVLALEKADGHAEVALLALLAKKIIVPT